MAAGTLGSDNRKKEERVPYIPPDTRWFLAEVVVQFDEEGGNPPLVHVNTKLIRADSPDEAFRKAQQLGQREESEYENTDGKRVRVKFRGLRDLFAVSDGLEDGAELLYEELIGLDESQIQALVREKPNLAVFRE
jgi:Domain of unknown function (DUF4288)